MGDQGEFKLLASFVSTAALKLTTFQVAARHGFRGALPSITTLHKPKPVTVLGWAIVRCQSRSGRWTSWPEAARGAELGRRCQSVIKSQVHGQERNIYYMYTDNSYDIYPVFAICTLAVQWESMRKVCTRSRVRTWFAPFLNPGICRYVLVHTSTNQYVHVCIGMSWYVLVCTGLYLHILVG